MNGNRDHLHAHTMTVTLWDSTAICDDCDNEIPPATRCVFDVDAGVYRHHGRCPASWDPRLIDGHAQDPPAGEQLEFRFLEVVRS